MKLIEVDSFAEVEMIRMGYSPIGAPLMSVVVYVVDGLVIDTGQQHMAKAVMEFLQGKTISRIILTHHHEDHSGNAAQISRRHSIPVMGHPLTATKLRHGFSIKPYQYLVWGKAPAVAVSPLKDRVETDRFVFVPIGTPGHSQDHTAFLEKQRGWLFSGDLYLGQRIKYYRFDERFADQIASLKKVLTLEFDTLFCAHNPSLANGKSAIRQKLQFLEDLYGQIKALAAKGLSEKAVIKMLDPRQDRFVKWLSLGKVSFANMVRSALASL